MESMVHSYPGFKIFYTTDPNTYVVVDNQKSHSTPVFSGSLKEQFKHLYYF